MEKITYSVMGPFSDTECPNGRKVYNLNGDKDTAIMAGTGSCRRCDHHVFLPLAGKRTFGCNFKIGSGF